MQHGSVFALELDIRRYTGRLAKTLAKGAAHCVSEAFRNANKYAAKR